MFNFKLIVILSIQVFSVFSFEFQNSRAKHLSERLRLATLHLDLSSTKEYWVEQRLDHFNPKERRTWQMRCFKKLDYWKPGGPIILYIDGEGEAGPWNLEFELITNFAQRTNGALFGTEHRYYGKSMPLNVRKTEDLKYLSSQQALADVAYFIKYIKEEINSTQSKVVVIGGSYAGNLAAWMRLKYPDLVDAALASSAPVFAKKNFIEYMQKVSKDFKKYGGDDCYNKIQNKFNRYTELFKTKNGIEQFKKDENICPESDMTKIENQQYFVSEETDRYATVAQYAGPVKIKNECSKLFSENLNASCIEINFNNTFSDLNAWVYQTCTEFGYFPTTCPPFTDLVSVDYFIKMCEISFGSDFNEKRVDQGVARTNKMYGGRNPKLSRVVFTNGNVDPWSTLGILKSISPDVPAIVIPDEIHCSDFDGRSPQSVKARKDATAMIMKWLQL